MKKMYEKPQAEIVIVRCKGRLLQDDENWGQFGNESNPYNTADAKEMQIRMEEEQEMHETLGEIFDPSNLVNPWQ